MVQHLGGLSKCLLSLLPNVSLLLSATAQPVVQDLLDTNKSVRDMRRSAAQSLHFHSFNETPWHQLVFASWADASDRPRPDGSRTGGSVISLATEKLFGDDVSVMAWRSFKLPRKIAGSNPFGWPGLLGQKCTVLRCDAGTWTKVSDRWVECSSQILEVSSMP